MKMSTVHVFKRDYRIISLLIVAKEHTSIYQFIKWKHSLTH